MPKHLQEPIARVLSNGKDRQAYLQKSTGTKDKTEAKRIAVDVLVGFRKTLDEAEALLAEGPLRTSLSQAEIDRIAEFYYVTVLAADEDFTTEGHQADEDLIRSVARQLTDAGIEYDMPAPLDTQRPPYGLTNRQVTKRDAELAWYLPIMRDGLSVEWRRAHPGAPKLSSRSVNKQLGGCPSNHQLGARERHGP